MSRLALRRAWFQVHKWIGLILMIVLIPLALSGSALVWHDWLDARLNPQRAAVSGTATLAPSAYAAAARAASGEKARIVSLRWPEDKGAVTVSLTKPGGADRPGPPQRTTIWLDPPSARVLDRAGSNEGLIRFLHAFHGSLTLPGVGRQIVGWLGVAMFLSCVSGLWLWWPTVGRWARGLRWGRTRDLDTNLHHLTGFWIVLPLAILAFTGVWIAWPQMIGGGGQGGAAARFRAKPLAETVMTPDAALAAAGAGRPAMLTWPTDKSGAWRVSLAGQSGRTKDYVVDDATGAVSPARPNPGAGGIARTMRSLHDGEGMGPIWQTIIFLGGIAPAVLGVTGITMWLRTRRWRAKAAMRQTRVAAPEAAE